MTRLFRSLMQVNLDQEVIFICNNQVPLSHPTATKATKAAEAAGAAAATVDALLLLRVLRLLVLRQVNHLGSYCQDPLHHGVKHMTQS